MSREDEVKIRAGNGEYYEKVGEVVIEDNNGRCIQIKEVFPRLDELDNSVISLQERCRLLEKNLDILKSGIKEITSNLINVQSNMSKDISELQYQVAQLQLDKEGGNTNE